MDEDWRSNACYYVTCRDAGRTGLLLGPYRTPDDAIADVQYGKELAEEADPFAAFYSFGVAKFSNGGRLGQFSKMYHSDEWNGRSCEMCDRGVPPDEYVSIGVP